MICGAGRITDELLKRMGENWEATLIEKKEARLEPFPGRFPSVVRLTAGDASSPVVLEKAGLAEQDCVLAMTNDDSVNLATARFAREAGVKNIMAVVRDPENVREFQKLNVWTLPMASDLAHRIYQFLKDPRLRIIDLGESEGELLELTVENQDLARLKDLASQREADWRLAGVLRDRRLLFPDDLNGVKEGDRLLILGKAETFTTFSRRLLDDRPHFPRTYGQQMILGIGHKPSLDLARFLNEVVYLAQGTHIDQIKAVYEASAADMRESLERWSESLRIDILEEEENAEKRAISIAQEVDAGIVVMPYTQGSLFPSIFGNRLVKMGRELPCPLLIAKSTTPYEHLLAPFNDSPSSRRALEIAVDLSQQLQATVSVVAVVEPSYLHGGTSSTEEWEQQALKQVREISHIHKTAIKEHVRHGNPVKEILAMADDYQLLVIGNDEREKGLFSIDVADMLAEKSPCSVLLV